MVAENELTDYKKLMWMLEGSGVVYDAYLVEGGVRVDVIHPHLGTAAYEFNVDEELVYSEGYTEEL